MNAVNHQPFVESAAHLAPPVLPVFLPRWFDSPDRLDARPVIWSLYERPEHWSYEPTRLFLRGYWFTHTPSRHVFIVSEWGVSGPIAGCGCDGMRWQFFQAGALRRAFWRYALVDKGVNETWAQKLARRWFLWRCACGPDWLEGENTGFAAHFVR